MDAATYKALSGAMAQMRRLEVTAQDLANVNSSGYKAQRISFSEMMENVDGPSERSGGLVAVSGTKTNMSPGEVYATGNPFNLAIVGEGYFVVGTPRGERYTRSGSFMLRGDGTMVTPAGDPLLGDGGPLQVTGGKLEVTQDGLVSSGNGQIGKLRIVGIKEAKLAIREGANLFQTDSNNLGEVTNVQIMQGGLEQSNVNPIDSMVLLIANQRHFDAYERAIHLMDSATEKMITEGAR